MTKRPSLRPTRLCRTLVGFVLALGLAIPAGQAAAASPAAQKIADHFSTVKSMSGEFVQFGPTGAKTGGKFYLERPGKLRFDYEKPSPVRVIADGRSVVVNNSKLDTWDIYPLSKTPLNLLLANRIDLSAANIRGVKEEPDLTTIVMGDRSVFGDSKITMMFDPSSNELRQWTITDAQGKDTTVMIFNVQKGVGIADKTFNIPYTRIEMKRQTKK